MVLESEMQFGDIPPIVLPSNSVGVAFVWAEGQGYIFYYNQTDKKLYVAEGKEETIYNYKPIAVGHTSEYIYWNQEPTPTPLAAGFNKLSDGRKEIRVYYVRQESQIGELVTEDFGKTWKHGALTSKNYHMALPGGLAAYPGDRWRVIVRMPDAKNTLVELYEVSEGSWDKYIIP